MLSKKHRGFFRNYREAARRVKEIVLEYDPGAEVYVFGSVLRGKYTALSDIDVLVVSNKKDLEYTIKVRIYKELSDVPLEVHYTDRVRFEKWYKKFIDTLEKI